MINLRKSLERGHANHGWLDTFHTFSFADYHDPTYMSFRALRVINEDWIKGNNGFGMHPHRDMEIITYVMEGELKHEDSLGNGSIIKAGDFQVMSAGTGVRHSEFNPGSETTHLYQIWIEPDTKRLKPSYNQKSIDIKERAGKLKLIAGKDQTEASMLINQDAKFYSGIFLKDSKIDLLLSLNRYGWLQVVKGELELNNFAMQAGDGASISMENNPLIKFKSDSEILFFDLA